MFYFIDCLGFLTLSVLGQPVLAAIVALMVVAIVAIEFMTWPRNEVTAVDEEDPSDTTPTTSA